MTTLSITLALGALTAVAAAIRSTWSPCGLSMLSTITPMAERSRGRRWSLTAAWFLLGAVIGGATLGLVAAGAAALVAQLQLSGTVTVAALAVAALVAVAMDRGFGASMPHHRRQVDEVWLDQFRSWVYGLGFGWQIGTGVATYIMTSAVYLTVAIAALSGSPVGAFAICVLFGAVRGAMIFLGVRLTDPERLRRFHARFDALRDPVATAMVGVEGLVAVLASLAAFGIGAAGVAASISAAAIVMLMVLGAQRRRIETSTTDPLPSPLTVTSPASAGEVTEPLTTSIS